MLESTLEWWGVAALMVVARDLNWIEFAMIWLGWQFRTSSFEASIFSRLSALWRWLAKRPGLACVLVGCAPVVVRLALVPIFPVPQPMVADEFSHLLIADTFMHGRLTNPMHPMWTYFESIHIIQRPSYNSMYFPAQAIALFAGALMGHPWFGVLLVTGLMCGCIVWALQPFMPARWAILAGMIAALRFGIIGYWANSYWGGSLAALGGALIVGSYGRIRREPSVRMGLLLGLGLGIIGLVRPVEGLVFALPFAFALLRRGWLSYGHRIPFAARTLAPAALVLGILLTALGVYFKTVTGNPFTPGYAINQREYGWPLVMPWQKASEPTFRHYEMRIYHEWEKGELEKKSGLVPTVIYAPFRLAMGWTFFLGPAFSIGFFYFWRALASRRIRALAISFLACAIVVFLEAGYPHYLAPATVCIVGIGVQCLRYSRAGGPGVLRGTTVVPLVLTILVAVVAIQVIAGEWLQIPYVRGTPTYLSWCCANTAGQDRKLIEDKVAAEPGSHVIFVSYHHGEFKTIEWVYNSADIDGSRIIWARDMGPEGNRDLLKHYPGRRFWIVDADDKPPMVRPYPSTVAQSASR